MTLEMTRKTMRVAKTVGECRQVRQGWRANSETVTLVPTMGALHEGHLALIRMARKQADRVVVSIFVNPAQFSPHEDYNRYPRMLDADLDACRAAGVDLVFVPDVAEMYPPGLNDITTVLPPAWLTEQLCGLTRPGHFTGVATIVTKLFNIVQPGWAIFGEKDAQQAAVIRQMVNDLNMPVDILTHPTVRDEHGLALSSRNSYLETAAELEAARTLPGILHRIRDRVLAEGTLGTCRVMTEATQDVRAGLSPEANRLLSIEYLEARDDKTFRPVEELQPGVRLLIAAHVKTEKTGQGSVRLIDNLLL